MPHLFGSYILRQQTRPDQNVVDSRAQTNLASNLVYTARTPTSFNQIDLFSRIHRQRNVITLWPSCRLRTCNLPLGIDACGVLIARKTKLSKPVANKDHCCDNPTIQFSEFSLRCRFGFLLLFSFPITFFMRFIVPTDRD